MAISLDQLPRAAAEKRAETKKYFSVLKRKNPKGLDLLMQELHDETFEKTDCMQCANCCKTTSPIFTDKDISRISKHLRLKEVDFINRYLKRDEDSFMVLKSAPCPFLEEDKACLIYKHRPKACSEYPHTNRRRFLGIAELTLKNTEICPAVFNILEELKKRLPV
ncbi:MAG: YkgJ family cysteine cluster protein [Flavobacteriaceae bacterium]|nr:YkgJ family cysteine cluster protein [Flavobacteriaceae bacterium]